MSHQGLGPFAVVGSGPVAVSFSHALVELGTPPLLIASRTLRNAELLARGLPTPIHVPAVALDDCPVALANDFSGTVLVLVSDMALTQNDFVNRLATIFPNASLAVHASGSLPSSCIAGSAPAILSMHPAVPFPPEVVTSLHDVVTALEGEDEAVSRGHDLAHMFGMSPFVLKDASSKPLYHAACCMSVNGAAVGVSAACDLLRVAAPSMHASLRARLAKNLACRGATAVERAVARDRAPGAALTGPVSRGDRKTVSVHLHALSSSRGCDKYLLESYRRISHVGIGTAWRAGRIDRATALFFKHLLSEEEGSSTPQDAEMK